MARIEALPLDVKASLATNHEFESVQQSLSEAPPVKFDVARQVRVFEPYLQYVELSLTGAAIQRHRLAISPSIQKLGASKQLENRVRTTFDLIEKGSKALLKAPGRRTERDPQDLHAVARQGPRARCLEGGKAGSHGATGRVRETHRVSDKGDFSYLREVNLVMSSYGTQAGVISGDNFSIDPSLGMELGYAQKVYLRAGVGNIQSVVNPINTSERQLELQPNVGLGLKLGRLKVDYAFANIGSVSGVLVSHIFSLGLEFAPRE